MLSITARATMDISIPGSDPRLFSNTTNASPGDKGQGTRGYIMTQGQRGGDDTVTERGGHLETRDKGQGVGLGDIIVQ